MRGEGAGKDGVEEWTLIMRGMKGEGRRRAEALEQGRRESKV